MTRSGLSELKQTLEAALGRMLPAESAAEARAIVAWPEIVGPQVARAAEPVALQGETLVVHTRNSAWSQELSFRKELLLTRLRERLGGDFVRDIRFRVAPIRGRPESARVPPPPEEVRRIRLPEATRREIAAACESEDPALREAAIRALTLEAQLREWHLRRGAKACPVCGAAYRSSRRRCPACERDDQSRASSAPGSS